MEPTLGVRQAWSSRLGEAGRLLLDVHVHQHVLTLASSDGTVAAIDARSGSDLWRTTLGQSLSAGVGSDGQRAAVVTTGNELVVITQGREVWRQRLGAQVYTAPLVAGERVFVLAADRSLSAFDAATGQRLWQQNRPGEALVLRQTGLLMAMGDTLVTGLSGRMVGLNPDNGTVRWEAPVATARGTNDVERLVELVGPVSSTSTRPADQPVSSTSSRRAASTRVSSAWSSPTSPAGISMVRAPSGTRCCSTNSTSSAGVTAITITAIPCAWVRSQDSQWPIRTSRSHWPSYRVCLRFVMGRC